MSEKHLHIISFDIPYPPNYGGVIDVFYKIRSLHRAGVKVHLHCFEYHRDPSGELEELCEEVNYYRRKTGFLSAITLKPYIVYSRRNKKLLNNLLKDNYPILFEGLHTCYYLSHPLLKNRQRIYRESNIEHDYYYNLSKTEKNIFRKLFFFFSGIKLRLFQKELSNASLMLTVSKADNEYLKEKFPQNKVEYLPSFHHEDTINCIPGKGDYVLYQGNLSVGENKEAVEYLVENIFSHNNIPFIVAGLNPPHKMKKKLSGYKNITLIENPPDEKMFSLVRNAHINLLITFQPTGLKLKLLNALFNGRFCLVNPEMVFGTELGPLCEVASSAIDLEKKLLELIDAGFDESEIGKRKDLLFKWHSNTVNCEKLLNFCIFV